MSSWPGTRHRADALAWVPAVQEQLHAAGLHRIVRHREQPFSHRGLIDLSSNDYLGLARDPRLRSSVERGVRWGVGAAASRLVVGGSAVHRELESAIAEWKQTEDSVVFSSGYLTNIGTIQAIVGPGDLVVSDALNHASIIDGCRLSGAEVAVYRHNDVGHARSLLADRRRSGTRALVVTDGIFSMDGDRADLVGLCDVAEDYAAMVMVDDAHGSGVVGPDGRGTPAQSGVADRIHVHVGTLSKAIGAAGGFVAGRADLVDHLRNRARPFVFDTAPPPAIMAAALTGVNIARSDARLRSRAVGLARRLATGLGLSEPAACIVPFVVGGADQTMALSAALADAGYLVVGIRPPSVPPGTARLRFTVNASLDEAMIDGAVDALIAAVANGVGDAGEFGEAGEFGGAGGAGA